MSGIPFKALPAAHRISPLGSSSLASRPKARRRSCSKGSGPDATRAAMANFRMTTRSSSSSGMRYSAMSGMITKDSSGAP
uniref:Uncharacterized protein n=1 Tax=Lutzomyia longipalpis TaxID=7200 RepID=A0A1B0CFL3_LUTLO